MAKRALSDAEWVESRETAKRALSDAAWIEICEAARLLPDPDARAELSAVLFAEYPNMVYDRKRVAAWYAWAKKALRHCNALAELYADNAAPRGGIRTEADLWGLKLLHRTASARFFGCQAMRRANAGRRDTQREFLISRLCGIWLDHFNGRDLTVSVPALGGPPRGPLIEFLFAAMRQVIPRKELPSREALPDMIRRERQERENAKQLRLQLEWRRNGVLKRES
jgi:hypothetical protein